MTILLLIVAVPIFLFLPGYFLTLFLPWVRGFSQRLSIAVVTSVAVGVVASVIFGNFLFWLLAAGSLAGLFFFRQKAGVIFEEWHRAEKKERIFVFSALLLSILGAVFIAAPHFGYPWPIHADEWWAVGTIQNVLEGQPLNNHPYFFTEFPNHKPGFTSYFSAIFGFLGESPVESWVYLPALNFFLISFTASLLLFHYSRNIFVGLALPVFLAALRSNAYMLGWWFFVPSMFAFLFILPLLITVSDWFWSRRGFFWAVIVFTALSLVYFPFSFFVVPVILFWAGIQVEKYRLAIFAGLAVIAIAAAAAGMAVSPYKIYWTIAGVPEIPAAISDLVHSFAVPVNATSHFVTNVDFLSIAGIPLLLLALAGLWLLRKNRWAAAFGWAALIGAVNAAFIIIGKFSFFTFHQRAFYFLAVTVAVLASIGFSAVFQKLLLRLNLHRFGVLIAGLLLIFIIFIFYGYFKLPEGTYLYHLVSPEDLAAMEWLKNQAELRGLAVLANAPIGTILSPLARLPAKVSYLTSQNIAAIVSPGELLFADKSCAEKEKLIMSLGVDLVYAKKPQTCDFLKEIYRSENVFIYRYEPR